MMLMRTTLTLDEDVLRLARRRAAEENRPLKDIINEVLRSGLTNNAPRGKASYKFRLTTVRGRQLPGVDLDDRDKLYDLMEE